MKRAFTLVEVVLVLAVLGGAWAAFPQIFPGASKRAKSSTTATARLEEATTNRDSTAAASVVKIGEANGQAPESPSKAFIAREVPVALSLLPAPDPMALIEAERRRAAVMEGRLAESNALYEKASKRAEELQRERDKALAERQAADLALEKAAAAEHARTVQAFAIGIVAILLLAAFLYVKFTGISPSSIGTAFADMAKGTDPTVAFDTVLNSAQQRRINRAKRLAM